ncbi:MAG: type II toxin-antitoxin system HicA family toxin [Flavobacteriales bacterium]|nr:type II toxin-antitoxin system HicA family toxin [Flavobacteriales bacterium]
MKIPRDISADDLVKSCRKLGYENTRQSGSHIRMTTQQNGEHHITIPNHAPVKIGTLSAILNDIAEHFGKTKSEFVDALF